MNRAHRQLRLSIEGGAFQEDVNPETIQLLSGKNGEPSLHRKLKDDKRDRNLYRWKITAIV